MVATVTTHRPVAISKRELKISLAEWIVSVVQEIQRGVVVMSFGKTVHFCREKLLSHRDGDEGLSIIKRDRRHLDLDLQSRGGRFC